MTDLSTSYLGLALRNPLVASASPLSQGVDRVRALAGQFDALVRQVAGDVGHVGDIRLFLMAALVLADELHETRTGAAR